LRHSSSCAVTVWILVVWSMVGSRCEVVTQPGIWQLHDRIGSVVIDTFAEQVQHFDGGA